MKAISVIIPAYNCKKYLESSVSSAASVNAYCKNAFIREIILVDDGSTDGSSELCDLIADKLSNDICSIQVIHQTNSGVSAARNRGLRESTGDYVLFMDSDDTVDPEKLAVLIDTISRDASIDMAVYGLSFDYYSGYRIYRKDEILPPVEGVRSFDECSQMMYSLYKCNMLSPLWNKLIRRSVLEEAGLRLREDMFLYEDLEFSLRAMAECRKFYFCTEAIYRYRQAADEGNAGRRLKRIAHIADIVDKIEDALAPFEGADGILPALYLVLAREKIGCASRKETDIICADFRDWIDRHGFRDRIEKSEYGKLLYNKQSRKLIAKRRNTRIRHCLANIAKKTFGDFRSWQTEAHRGR
ncbi:MAG: glycosyltransferase family 2 protein [Clostridia bacterium]|nr:glycosyltransferase family 2 protein [Clostridia bacterium]